MTRDDIIKIAKKARIAKHGLGWTCWEGQLEHFAALVAAAEREACAKVCEKVGEHQPITPRHCAAAIRARGQA